MGPFWLRKITTDPNFLALGNTVCPDDKYAKLKMCISALTYEYTPAAYVNNALYNFTVIKNTVDRFVGYRGFLNWVF